MIIVPTVGKNKDLALIFASNLFLRLFSNDITPSIADTLGSYTEVTGGGYAEKTLTGGSWTISNGIATYASQLFTFTGTTGGSGQVYGYYVVDGAGVVRFAERFSESQIPYTVINGSTIRINPRYQIN